MTWTDHQRGCLSRGKRSGTQGPDWSRRGGIGLKGRMEDPEVGMTSDSWWSYCSRRKGGGNQSPLLTKVCKEPARSLHCAVSMGFGPTGGRTDGIISWQKLKQVQFYSHIYP